MVKESQIVNGHSTDRNTLDYLRLHRVNHVVQVQLGSLYGSKVT